MQDRIDAIDSYVADGALGSRDFGDVDENGNSTNRQLTVQEVVDLKHAMVPLK